MRLPAAAVHTIKARRANALRRWRLQDGRWVTAKLEVCGRCTVLGASASFETTTRYASRVGTDWVSLRRHCNACRPCGGQASAWPGGIGGDNGNASHERLTQTAAGVAGWFALAVGGQA